MIIISKAERDVIVSKFPSVTIVRAKHHYYCEEDRRVMRMLGRDNNSAYNRKRRLMHKCSDEGWHDGNR